MGEMRRMLRAEIDQVNEYLERLETRIKIQPPRRKDRWRNFEDEYDVRRQEKHALTFVEIFLKEFDCKIQRLKEFVEKENKKRENEEEKESEKSDSIGVIGSFREKEIQIEKEEREKGEKWVFV